MFTLIIKNLDMQEKNYVSKIEEVKLNASILALIDSSKEALAKLTWNISETLISKVWGKDNYTKVKIEDSFRSTSSKYTVSFPKTPAGENAKTQKVAFLLNEIKNLLGDEEKGLRNIKRVYKNNGAVADIDKTTLGKVQTIINKVSA